MAVSVAVDEELLDSALKSGEESSEAEVVDAALRLLVQLRSQRAAAELWARLPGKATSKSRGSAMSSTGWTAW
jgi:Arc/MetJ family transcription regulator